jgi:hypothetical protein
MTAMMKVSGVFFGQRVMRMESRMTEKDSRPRTAWLDRLQERSRPLFSQLAIWFLLLTALVAGSVAFHVDDGPRQGPATLLSWLPSDVLSSDAAFWIFRAILWTGATLWALNRLLPWSSWLTVIGLTGLWSLHVENTTNTNHCFHMANNLLVIYAIWATVEAREIKAAIAERRYWTTPLVPRWVTLGCIAYIGLFHTAAGLSKLTFSGPGWANGVSLQLWTHLWGRPWMPTTQMILSSRTFTQWLQVGTLVIETAGILAIFPRLRTLIGVATLGFYAGVLLTFDYGFQFNALFTAVYLLPVERWLTGRTGFQRADEGAG